MGDEKCRICGGSQCGPNAHPSKRTLDHVASMPAQDRAAILALGKDPKAAQDLMRDLQLLRFAGVSVEEIKAAIDVVLAWPVR